MPLACGLGDDGGARLKDIGNEVVQLTLRVPRNARAVRSNYEFSHQNGVIEANEFEEMPEPTAIVDEDGVLVDVETEEEETP